VVIFDEQVRGGAWYAMAAAGGLALVLGTFVLVRSPLLSDSSGDSSDEGDRSAAAR
jgi:hypothetical protein